MFDESYCAGMALGPAQVSISGLNELAAVLKLLFPNQALGARSRPLKKERGSAKEKGMPHFYAIRLELKHHHPEGPPTPNLKGLIQALADLLLEAAGAESVKAKGGEHEHQDYA